MPNVALIMYLAEIVERFTSIFIGVGIIGLFVSIILFALSFEGGWEWMRKKMFYVAIAMFIMLMVGLAIPSKNVIYVYAGQEVAEHIVENPSVQNEAKDIYKDLKTILHNIATEKKETK